MVINPIVVNNSGGGECSVVPMPVMHFGTAIPTSGSQQVYWQCSPSLYDIPIFYSYEHDLYFTPSQTKLIVGVTDRGYANRNAVSLVSVSMSGATVRYAATHPITQATVYPSLMTPNIFLDPSDSGMRVYLEAGFYFSSSSLGVIHPYTVAVNIAKTWYDAISDLTDGWVTAETGQIAVPVEPYGKFYISVVDPD